jgi:hypothetical protein
MRDHQGKQRSALGHIGTQVLQFLGRQLKTGNPAATMDRLFVSQHVGDLRFIVAVALVLLCISVVPCLVYVSETARSPGQPFLWNAVKVIAAFIGLFATVFAVVGAICAWAYKVGSARLGVVDLFACEISTICRVATLLDTVGRFMDRIKRAEKANSEYIFPPAELKPEAVKSDEQASNNRANSPLAMRFTSAENYFPVFEGNTRDLQSLEARVVIDITSFYTYMKTVRDLMRAAAALKSEPVTLEASKADQLHADTWHNAMRDVIYVLFLGLEAGRSSIHNLVEFEPEQAERTIIILLSELKAYLFLLQEFANSDDMRERRLLLRWETYQTLVEDLGSKIKREVERAKAAHMLATGVRCSQTEISTKALTLEIWQGAEKLWPDLKLLYQKLEEIIPKPNAA